MKKLIWLFITCLIGCNSDYSKDGSLIIACTPWNETWVLPTKVWTDRTNYSWNGWTNGKCNNEGKVSSTIAANEKCESRFSLNVSNTAKFAVKSFGIRLRGYEKGMSDIKAEKYNTYTNIIKPQTAIYFCMPPDTFTDGKIVESLVVDVSFFDDMETIPGDKK